MTILPQPPALDDGRYIGIVCPYCGARSPTVDLVVDARRQEMSEWWAMHRLRHEKYPVIERRLAL